MSKLTICLVMIVVGAIGVYLLWDKASIMSLEYTALFGISVIICGVGILGVLYGLGSWLKR